MKALKAQKSLPKSGKSSPPKKDSKQASNPTRFLKKHTHTQQKLLQKAKTISLA